MKKAVIIGAGQNGRGLIAPIVQKNEYQITFIDKDKTLISQLAKEQKYTIYFFGKSKTEEIKGFSAYVLGSSEANTALSEADVIFTSVFANNIASLIPYLQQTTTKDSCIICCENGVNVKQPLIDASIQGIISEGVIFCTTSRPDHSKLDVWSEDFHELPIAEIEGVVQLDGMPLEKNFPSLIQRKIYTYNFISAVVAYLGSYLGYQSYGDAANDPVISQIITKLVPIISRIVASEFDVGEEEQLAFTNRAVVKFSNRAIVDSIQRNAQQAERKLGENERLLVPLKLAIKYGEDTESIELVIAAALYYGETKEGADSQKILTLIENIFQDSALKERIYTKLNVFKNSEEVSI